MNIIKYYLDRSLPVSIEGEEYPVWYMTVDGDIVITLNPIHTGYLLENARKQGYVVLEITRDEYELLYVKFMLSGGYNE